MSAVAVSAALPTTTPNVVLTLKAGEPLSVAVTVIVEEPSPMGVPEKVRVLASKDSHAGRPLAV